MNSDSNQSVSTPLPVVKEQTTAPSARKNWEELQKEATKRKILWRKTAPKEKKVSSLSYVLVQVKRVVNVTKGGRRFRFYAIAAAGNRTGMVGIGSGKANEVSLARDKAFARAEKNMITVPIVKDTISHPVHAKFCSSRIFLKPASQGSGLIVGGSARALIELVGIKNISGKAFGSNNRMNLLKATLKALQKLQPPRHFMLARGLIKPNPVEERKDDDNTNQATTNSN